MQPQPQSARSQQMSALATGDNAARHIVVIGGGISGLTAAYTAAKAGCQVTVVEKNSHLGGPIAKTTITTPDGDVTVDAGAEAILNRRPEGVALATELGLTEQLTYPTTSHAMIYRHGQLHPMPTNTAMGIPTATSDGLDGLFDDAAQQHIKQATPRHINNDCSVADYVNTLFGPEVTDTLVEPLLGGVYAGHATKLSLRSTMPAIWKAATEGRLPQAAGTSANGTTGQNATTPGKTTPAVTLPPVFAGLVGGINTLINALASNLRTRGATIHCNTKATQLTRQNGRWQVQLTDLTDARATDPATTPINTESNQPTLDQRSLDASHVIITTQAPHAAELLAPLEPAAANLLSQTPTASMALVTLAVNANDLADLAYSGVLVPPAENLTVKAITFATTKWQWLADQTGNYAIVRASLGRQGDNTINQTDHQLLTTATNDINTILGRTLTIHGHTITRWPDALPQFTVGHHDRTTTITHAINQHPGLAITGALFEGLGIPACINHAQNTTTQLLTH